MKHLYHALMGLSLAVAISTSASAKTLTAESSTASGSTHLVLQVMATYGGQDLQINSGQTLTKACLKVAKGEIDMTTCPPPAYGAMKKGAGPYKKTAADAKANAGNLRALFGYSGGFFHVIVRADSGIKNWSDIKGRSIFTGPPSGSANMQSQMIIEAASGFKAGDDYEAIRLDWGSGLQAFQDGQFAVFMRPTSLGVADFEQIGTVRLLSLPDQALSSKIWKNFVKQESRKHGYIPANTYRNVVNGEKDIRAAEYTMQVSVNKNMSDDTAYNLTKSFFDNLKAAQRDIKTMLSIKPKDWLVGVNMPVHCGAMKYMKEKKYMNSSEKCIR